MAECKLRSRCACNEVGCGNCQAHLGRQCQPAVPPTPPRHSQANTQHGNDQCAYIASTDSVLVCAPSCCNFCDCRALLVDHSPALHEPGRHGHEPSCYLPLPPLSSSQPNAHGSRGNRGNRGNTPRYHALIKAEQAQLDRRRRKQALSTQRNAPQQGESEGGIEVLEEEAYVWAAWRIGRVEYVWGMEDDGLI
jgi:hypothetical protein